MSSKETLPVDIPFLTAELVEAFRRRFLSTSKIQEVEALEDEVNRQVIEIEQTVYRAFYRYKERAAEIEGQWLSELHEFKQTLRAFSSLATQRILVTDRDERVAALTSYIEKTERRIEEGRDNKSFQLSRSPREEEKAIAKRIIEKERILSIGRWYEIPFTLEERELYAKSLELDKEYLSLFKEFATAMECLNTDGSVSRSVH